MDRPTGVHDEQALLRRVGGVMGLIAVSLVVASAAHLSGHVHGRSAPFDGDHAGVAEAIIAVVLGIGALTAWRGSPGARSTALATTGFATAGFLVGLQFTARGGHLPDVAYHVTILPVLVAILVVLARARRPARHTPEPV